MKRRLGGFAKRKPIVQLDDVPKENFGLGFKKETGNEQSPRCDNDFNDRYDSNMQGSEDPLNAVQFVKSEQKTEVAPEDLDSKLNDFFKEINELVVEGPSQKKVKADEPKKSSDAPKEPTPPTCAWQAVLDESSQCCYYWNVETNQSTWEEPLDYTEYLLKYHKFEEEYSARAKERQQNTNNSGSSEIDKAKQSSPSLVPYECIDDTLEDNRPDSSMGSDNDGKENFEDGPKDEDIGKKVSKKRPNEVDGFDVGTTCVKKMKLDDNMLASLILGQQEIEQRVFQIEEAGRLLNEISQKLEDCDHSLKINGCSVEHIQGVLQTRVEDWRAGYLPTSYLVSKLQEWLSSVQGFTEEKMEAIKSPSKEDELALSQNAAVHEPYQPPPPPPMECAPPPPPEVEEDAQPSITRSLISVDYGEDTDDDNATNSEANTEPSLSRNSSPFPPLEEADIPATNSTGNSKVKTSTKKSKPLVTDSISMRKKKVSSMVEKWQKIQQELEQ